VKWLSKKPERLEKHHLYWPRTRYKTQLERKFRNHPNNIVLMPHTLHQVLHLRNKPPKKPSPEAMHLFLQTNGTKRGWDK
jgi:hypothetical protein